jgi:outer membrane autotransporter protein
MRHIFRKYSLQINIIFAVLFISFSQWTPAASTGGCDVYTPDAYGSTVTCTSTVIPAATAGIISTQGSTSVGNNITVNIGANTILDIVGSTVGVGSGSTVNNSGTLRTNSFYYGYGISIGANGRSQAGGATVNNYGIIITGGTNASGINISSTNALSTASTVLNAGTITTTGNGAHGIQITNGGALASVSNSGTINVSGTNAYGINIQGAASITNSGTISSSSTAINFSGTIPAGLKNTLTISTGSNITGAIAFSTSGINETLTFDGYTGSLNNTITGLNTINATNSSAVTMNNAAGLTLVNGQVNVDSGSSLQIDSVIKDQVTPTATASSLTKTGTGTLTLTGTNSYTGGTTVSGGTLKGTSSSLQGNIVNNASVNFSQNTDGTYSGVMSGTGALTKDGSGVLVISGVNTYTGNTSINAGTINLTGSITSNTTLASGATLQGTGTVFANLVNAGTIQPSANNQLANLTISGNYSGQSGKFITNIYAPVTSPLADQLIVGGVISGTTGIVGVDRGGLGKPTTGNGIQVVQGSGSASSFTISGRVASGAYEYRLFQGNAAGSNSSNWYLRTDNPTPPVIAVTPDSRQRVEVVVYPALPSLVQLYSQSVVDTLDQRRADLSIGNDKITENTSRDWARIIGKTGSSTPSQINDGPSLDFNAYAFQFGLDLLQHQELDGARTYLGPYVTIGSANGKTMNQAGTTATGSINGLTAYSFGISGTHFTSNGLYIDVLGQYSRYLRALGSSYQNAQVETQGTGFTASLEAGGRWNLDSNYFISPQVQMVYDSIGMENSTDQYGQINFNKSEISRGRVGLLFGHRNLSSSLPLYAHIRASYWNIFNPGTSTTFQSLYGANPISFDSQSGSKYLALDGQISTSVSPMTSLFLNLGWENSLVGTYQAWNARLGVLTKF